MAVVSDAAQERRVLVAAPTPRDAHVTQSLLAKAGLDCFICETLQQLSEELAAGAGAILLTEEVITNKDISVLFAVLEEQPPWSDVPIVMLMQGGVQSPAAARVLEKLKNVTLLERPVSTRSVLSVVSAAVRSRERQYQIRRATVERERLLESERSTRAEAERANLAKDRFLATLSHELRTPLTPIFAATQMLEKHIDPSSPALEYLSVIKRNAALEVRLIDDLLDLNRIIHGKVAIAKRPIGLHSVIRNAYETRKADAEGKDIVVELVLQAARDEIIADPARIEQVFWNLFSNAIKFTTAGGSITVTSDVQDETIAVSVADTGKGITADLLEKIFCAFEQGDRGVTEKFGGLGLGLAISKNLVALHGGSIEAQSAGPGQGSTFIVRLPLTSPALKVQETQEPMEDSVGSRKKVLLVEDHDDTARMMKQVLELNGLQVVHAGSVSSALTCAQREHFDLMLCDLGLPDGSGLDVMKHIGRKNIRGLALTGRGMESDVKACAEAGFLSHLTKPVDMDRLEKAVKDLLALPAL